MAFAKVLRLVNFYTRKNYLYSVTESEVQHTATTKNQLFLDEVHR